MRRSPRTGPDSKKPTRPSPPGDAVEIYVIDTEFRLVLMDLAAHPDLGTNPLGRDFSDVARQLWDVPRDARP